MIGTNLEIEMPKIDESTITPQKRDRYPGVHKKVTEGYERLALGDSVNLDQFGVNKVSVAPGASTALRHWHENEDEFVIVFSGEVILVEDDGETILRAGDSAGFKAGVPNGHHIVNKSNEIAVLFEIGTRCKNEVGHYTGLDFEYRKSDGEYCFVRDDGTILG